MQSMFAAGVPPHYFTGSVGVTFRPYQGATAQLHARWQREVLVKEQGIKSGALLTKELRARAAAAAAAAADSHDDVGDGVSSAVTDALVDPLCGLHWLRTIARVRTRFDAFLGPYLHPGSPRWPFGKHIYIYICCVVYIICVPTYLLSLV